MSKRELWSISTTMRNPNRAIDFLRIAKGLEGSIWDDETQNLYQILLIKNRYYKPNNKNLNENQIAILKNQIYDMTIEEAKDIYFSKGYVDPPMRGRTSFSPLVKLGLATLERDNQTYRIKVTDFGNKFLTGVIKLEDVVLLSFLKLQRSDITDSRGFNVKPFICLLKIIRNVNLICRERNIIEKGISLTECGIFCLSLTDYRQVENVAQKIINFRIQLESIRDFEDKKAFVNNYIGEHLSAFNNPHKNVVEYMDNILRYLRLTKYVILRGGGQYIDLEHRRDIEINAILANDDGSASMCTEEEYNEYLANPDAYVLPFETLDALVKIANDIKDEIHNLENELAVETGQYNLHNTIDGLKLDIKELRDRRTILQNQIMRLQFVNNNEIETVVQELSNLGGHGIRPSIQFEKLANVALNIFDDAIRIKSNAHFDDENEIIYTAPAGVADIECFYEQFNAICEVTTLSSQQQWFNEGQAVMDHLRRFEDLNCNNESYCIFVAPRIHKRTYDTFWIAVKYEFEGIPQKIIPLTIDQFISMLKIYRKCLNMGFLIKHDDMKVLYDSCVNVRHINSALEWRNHLKAEFEMWKNVILNRALTYATR